MGDSSGGRERDMRERDWERERERLLMSDSKEGHSVYSPSSLSPMRSEEFDHQQSSITLLKAQLKLVTQERDLLKKDMKRVSAERDGAIRHLSLSTGSPQSSLDTGRERESSSHHRTNSDTAPSSISKQGASSGLARSHSIAAAGDKSLSVGIKTIDIDKSPDRIMQELQYAKKQHSDGMKKLDQALKDVDYYRQEAENLRTRYNDVVMENQRLDQETLSLRRFLDEDRKEMSELRRQHQELLSAEGGPSESMSIMYGTLLRKYEAVKDDFSLLSKRYDDLVTSHSAAVAKYEHSQEEILRYKKQYEDMLIERNKFKQQCTQAIRQWDQALRERNDYRDALAKVQRQHEEAVKEINQAMAVRIKASKDIKRLTEERNAAMQEYALIMSERDSVHKEIEKLQDEVSTTNTKMKEVECSSKKNDEEKRSYICQIELLKREIEAALLDRDKAIKEAHELRETAGEREKSSLDNFSNDLELRKEFRQSKTDMEKHYKQRNVAGSDKAGDEFKDDFAKVENLDQAIAEIERLRKDGEKLQGDLSDASMEADVAKGRRDWAFSERDKVVLERESIRTLCDKLRRERDRAVSELAEALRDLDEVKKRSNELNKDNKELRDRIENIEKETRMRMLQRSVGHSHSRDSAIDTDLQDWETETIDVNMGEISNDEDLGLDLAGGRDDPVLPGDSPVYIASITKGSVVDGKLKVNDCILRVNNLDCRDVDRSTVMSTLRSAASTVSLVVRRRRAGRRYQAVLHLSGGRGDHGITLDSGIYISRISPGSVSARESGIAVGDRVLSINESHLDHVRSVQDATALLNRTQDISITLLKNAASCGPLSSSSSGHCMMEEDKLCSPKTLSAATSPIKDQGLGPRQDSRELGRRLVNRDVQTEKFSSGSGVGGIFHSSSSSEKVFGSKSGSREDRSKGGWVGQITETVREKLETVGVRRGRRYSKEQETRDRTERSESGHYSNLFSPGADQPSPAARDQFDQNKETEMALEVFDTVLDSIHTETVMSSLQSSGGGQGGQNNNNGGSTKSGKKKRKDRDSFKNGGTWPRARGGPIIEQGTGTILHPHKQYKERKPLSELLTNMPKYPMAPGEEIEDKTEAGSSIIYRDREEAKMRHSRKYRDYRATTYDLVSAYNEHQDPSYHLMTAGTVSRERLTSAGLLRDTSEDRKDRPGYMTGALPLNTPSDTSIDDSVKSGYPMTKYLSHKSKSGAGGSGPGGPVTSDSEHTSPGGADHVSPPPPVQAPPLYKPDMSGYHLPGSRPSPSGFPQYFMSHSHGHSQAPGPRYSSPPPLLPHTVSGESILGSPLPRGASGSGFEDRLYPPLDPPHSLSSISPTPGLYHGPVSPSPCLDMFGKSRSLLPSHHHPYHPPSPYGAPSVFSNNPNPGLHGHGGGGGSSIPSQMSGYGYKFPDEMTMSPPTYQDYTGHSDPRIQRYCQDPPRVQRIRNPSNPSVGSVGSKSSVSKISSSNSISGSGERGSPLPPPSYHVEILSGRGFRPGVTHGSGDPHHPHHKPFPGEIRAIHIEKSSEQLGIKIEEVQCPPASSTATSGSGTITGGVFVSSVSSNSLADQAGLQVGDQLLEVCGINLRMANYTQAAQVLHRVGNSIDIKVQFNPDKYLDKYNEMVERSDSEEEEEESSEEEEEDEDRQPPPVPMRRSSPQRSGSPTPRNSPKVSRRGHGHDNLREPPPLPPASLRTSLQHSGHSTLTRHQVEQIAAAMAGRQPQPPVPDREPPSKYHEPRLVYPIMKKSTDLGVRLVGGNAVGIFIHSVDMDSPAYRVGLRSADHILEYNGTDLRHAPAEQAAYELAKPADTVAILVQFNPDKYEAIKDQPGDSYYVRAMFDRVSDSGDPLLLRFKKDDILYVDNTMYNGVPGQWSAWLVDQDGQKGTWGVIPSKYKVEEELLLKGRAHTDIESNESSRRSSTSTRRSFFKRRKAGRSSSRDSKELASYFDVASLLSYSDSGTLHEDPGITSYTRVEKWDYSLTRPVLILGPLADAVVDKLVSDYPYKFVRCQPEYMDCDMSALEKGVLDNMFVDFRRRGSHYEVTTVSSVKDVCDRRQHCVLDIHVGSVERLHQNQIYPIVLLIKFKSVKQIKEVKDPRYHAEKITQKDAKNIYEHTLKLEGEYKHLLSDTVPAGANLMLITHQIQTKIDQEQNKTLWVPSGTIW